MGRGMIASHVSGRLRLRHPGLRNPIRSDHVSALLRERPAVLSVEANPAAGSLLIRYDQALSAPERMEADLLDLLAAAGLAANPAVDQSEKSEADREPAARRLNRYAKIGMLASLSASLAALTVGKRAHAAFGALHVGLLMIHLANHRSRLWH